MYKPNLKLILSFLFYSFASSPRSLTESEMDRYHEALQLEEYQREEEGYPIDGNPPINSTSGASSSTDHPVHLSNHIQMTVDEYLKQNVDGILSQIDRDRLNIMKNFMSYNIPHLVVKYKFIGQILNESEKQTLVEFFNDSRRREIIGDIDWFLDILISTKSYAANYDETRALQQAIQVAIPEQPAPAVQAEPEPESEQGEEESESPVVDCNDNYRIAKVFNKGLCEIHVRNAILKIIKAGIEADMPTNVQKKNFLVSSIESVAALRKETETFALLSKRMSEKLPEKVVEAINSYLSNEQKIPLIKLNSKMIKVIGNYLPKDSEKVVGTESLEVIKSAASLRRETETFALLSKKIQLTRFPLKLVSVINSYLRNFPAKTTATSVSDMIRNDSAMHFPSIKIRRGARVNATIISMKEENSEDKKEFIDMIIDFFIRIGVIEKSGKRYNPKIELPELPGVADEKIAELRNKLENQINDEITEYVRLISKPTDIHNLKVFTNLIREIISEKSYLQSLNYQLPAGVESFKL